MSFLQKLKEQGVRGGEDLLSETEEATAGKVAQLLVDVYRTEQTIVIYAQSAGAAMNDVQVSIEGEANIVLIQGTRIRPEHIAFPNKKVAGSFVARECLWGDFYKRIILPESVDIEKSEAKINNGVLILMLPLLKTSENRKLN